MSETWKSVYHSVPPATVWLFIAILMLLGVGRLEVTGTPLVIQWLVVMSAGFACLLMRRTL